LHHDQQWWQENEMNFLPDMEHVEVILLSGIIATTVFVTVSITVMVTVYLATRGPAHKAQTVAGVEPVKAQPATNAAAARSPYAHA